MATHSDLMGSRSARRPTRGPGWWRWALLIAAGLFTAVFVYSLSMVGVAVQEATEPIAEEVLPEARPVAVQAGQRINILAMGLDDEKLRSDTMLLVSIDPENGQTGVIQIPRDTRALLAGKGTFEKINAAYAFGVGDKQFPANLRALKTVEDLLDISIHYTVVVDLDGFRKIVDAIDGVEVNIPVKMDYDDPTQDLHIHFEPGRQKLNGTQALEFVRWRKNNDGTETGYPDGDLGRIRTQQQFLGLVLDKMLRPANLINLPNQLLTLAKHVKTTVDTQQMLSLAKLAASMDRSRIEFATLPGTDAYLYDPHEDKRLSFYLADPEATAVLVNRLVRGINSQTAGGVQIQVAGSGSDPQAVRLAGRLGTLGFAVTDGPAEELQPEKTRIVDLTGDEGQSQLVAKALISMGYSVEILSQPVDPAPADVRVIPGRVLPSN